MLLESPKNQQKNVSAFKQCLLITPSITKLDFPNEIQGDRKYVQTNEIYYYILY